MERTPALAGSFDLLMTFYGMALLHMPLGICHTLCCMAHDVQEHALSTSRTSSFSAQELAKPEAEGRMQSLASILGPTSRACLMTGKLENLFSFHAFYVSRFSSLVFWQVDDHVSSPRGWLCCDSSKS